MEQRKIVGHGPDEHSPLPEIRTVYTWSSTTTDKNDQDKIPEHLKLQIREIIITDLPKQININGYPFVIHNIVVVNEVSEAMVPSPSGLRPAVGKFDIWYVEGRYWIDEGDPMTATVRVPFNPNARS
jgi:hypothetical protein